jgi:TonB family protein
MFRRTLACLFLLAAFAISAGAQTDTWLEVRTPHFLVISNSTEKDARRSAAHFERMRSVLSRVFPDTNVETATPIVVLAVADKRNIQALEPAAYLGKGKLNLLGLFLQAPEKDFVLIWLDAPGQYPYAPVYHEYTHFVLSRTGEWMPLWLSEGLAQFYQTAEILDNEVRLGKLDTATWQFLQRNPLLPLATLFTVDTHSPYYHEEDNGSMFYAESWALTHYLKMKDDREGTHRLLDYLDLMHKNVAPVAAAAQAFGDLTQLQSDLQKYIVNGDFTALEVPGSTDVDDSSFTVRTLSQDEADTVRADFLAYDDRENDARSLLETVLHNDPTNVSAHETMGHIAFHERNFEEARKWYQQAVKLDPQSFLAHYGFAASSIKKGMPDAASQAGVEESLRTTIKLNPSFAPAYEALGVFLGMKGKNYDEAHEWAQKSIQLDPGNVEFRIDDAGILMQANRTKEAIDGLELALKMTHTPEQTAAVEGLLQSARTFDAARAKMQHQNLAIREQSAKSGSTGTSQNGGATAAVPRATYTPEAEYTEEARQAKREGTCVVMLMVGIDGKPSNIVVTKKLGMGLDEKAVESVRKWRFEPARRYGKPVAAPLRVSITFKLYGTNDKILELSEKARGGDAAAEFELANAFFDGRDIPKDESQGLALLERAARDGLAQAQFQMGERTYGHGDHPETYVAAYVWYALAQRGGVEQGEAKKELLTGAMSPEQLSEAQKRLDNWATPSTK